MKIREFRAENIKRLSVVEIKPDGNLVQITGRNGSGKSSVLDSIWYALAGTDTLPSQPIRKGETKGSIKLDLGDFVVTRRFTLKGSTITVESKDGAKYPSPQTLLDGLVGPLSFDPLWFTRRKPIEQVDTLRRMVKLEVDIDALDAMNKQSYDERTELNRSIKTLQAQQAQYADIPSDLPAKQIGTKELASEIASAAKHNAESGNAVKQYQNEAAQLRTDIATIERQVSEKQTRAEKLHQEVRLLEQEAASLYADINAARLRLDSLQEPTISLIDVSVIQERLAQAQTTNAQIQRREQRDNLTAAISTRQTAADNLTKKLTEREQWKVEAITSAKMPVEGLGFGDGCVTFNGLPLDQASSAEQIRVSCAIAMANHPKLHVLRIKDGSLLDADSLALLSQLADDNDWQIWIERVTNTDKVGIVLEDGHVAE